MFKFVVFFCLMLSSFVEGAPLIEMRGFLGKEAVAKIKQKIEEADKTNPAVVAVEVSSSSGDLYGVLDIAKMLYEWKQQKHVKVIVYINDVAIGPSAVIPFLADELEVSPFVAWGDVPSGAEGSMATNLLRSRVRSLIDEKSPNAALLQLMADAMVDPSVIVIDDSGWKLATKEEVKTHPLISSENETLVVNQNQLQSLRLISKVTSSDDFRHLYQTGKEKPAANRQVEVVPLVEKPRQSIHFQPQGTNLVGYITIDDRTEGINQSTWIYVKSALGYYKENKPICIILRLDTPGGEVFAAQKISDALKEMDTQYHIPVIAFIDNWAISAGAMLAYSCRFIAVVKDASMGAAEPVFIEGTEMKAAPEKVNSALRADFGNRARFFDRDPLIAEAMVDKDMILVLRHGQMVKLDSEQQIRTTGPDPDKVISPKGKLLTLTAQELVDYGVADLLLPPTQLVPITEAERSQHRWPASKTLLFQYPFLKEIPNTTVDVYTMDWKTLFLTFLARPAVASLLFLGMMLGFYIEVSTPGFGLAGSVAVTCLFLIVLSSFALEAVGWLEVILLAMGVILLVVDIFFLPTFGFLGTVGTLFFIAGLFGLLLPGIGSVGFEVDTQTFNAAGEAVLERLAWLCGSLLLSIFLIAILARYMTPKLTFFNRFVSSGEQPAGQGYVAGMTADILPKVGDEGEAVTTLRPAGKVAIQNTLYDAVSIGTFIEKGSSIIVVAIDGNRIVVDNVKRGKGS